MICNCGWKYDGDQHETCPMCGDDPPDYKTGIGMNNHSDEDRAARRYKSLTRNVRPKPISKRRKQRLSSGNGEAPVFEKIWSVRKHKCQNLECREDLPEPARAHYFAHIHSKGARPDLRLDLRNIVLLCLDCENKSCDEGWQSIKLPSPYKEMRDTPPPFNPT